MSLRLHYVHAAFASACASLSIHSEGTGTNKEKRMSSRSTANTDYTMLLSALTLLLSSLLLPLSEPLCYT
jgi:hypothetical protein